MEEWPIYKTANAYTYAQTKENARKNRQRMTHAERMLWNEIKGTKLGLHVRRQHVIGNYIVDFAILENNLVIEIDGGYHGEAAQVDEDAYRDWYLEQRGFKVLHFTNDKVETDVENVVDTIIKNL